MAKGKLGYKIRTITCIACGKKRTDHMPPRQKYCSHQCFATAPKPERKTGKYLNCETCGKRFWAYAVWIKNGRRFCGTPCQNEWQSRNKTTHSCRICGCEFRWSPSRSKKPERILYCSIPCRDKDPERRAMLIQMNAKQQLGRTTSIEIIGYSILDDLEIVYKPQEPMFGKFCVDAWVPGANAVIQFDGDYWHGHPERFPNPDKRVARRIKLDRSQDVYMKKAGVTVVRIWGSDLRKDREGVKSRLRRLLVP